MSAPGNDHTSNKPQGLELVRRNRWPRVAGVTLCAIAILAAMLERGNHPMYWVATFVTIALWPQIAYLHASRSPDPLKAERLNLWLDSAHVGFWMAAIHFQPMPTAALLMATSLSNVTVGGLRFLALGWAGHLTGAGLGVLFWGAHWAPQSSVAVQLATLPLLLAYPWLMGQLMFKQAMQLKHSRRELRFLSEHDALSGVHNRRYFDHALQLAFRQFQRKPRNLTLLICDVDDFKTINDRHGHAVGDVVIRHVAAALTHCARAGDAVARLGGDEFVVLLSDADADQAMLYADRVQAQLDNTLHIPGRSTGVRLSFGVAMAEPSWHSYEHWLEQADAALYKNKAERQVRRSHAKDMAGTDAALAI
ncbi:diguanylate cyclase domain-containing protein [Hydrogenophaga aquatica]